MEYVNEGLFPHIKVHNGIWHDIYNVLLIFYIVFGISMLIFKTIKEKNVIAKKRLGYILAACVCQSLFFFLTMVDIIGSYDLTAFGYAISTIFMYIAIFKYDLLDMLELAKDYVVDEVSEAIIAVDNNNRLEYYNKPSKILFPKIRKNAKSIIGMIKNSIDNDTPLKLNDRIYSPEEKVLYQNNMSRGKVFVLVDDTQHYEYMEELKEQKELAEAASASKSAFLSIVSHEIRTPMNAVIGMTDLLLRDELTDKQRKYMTNIKNSGSALVMIINDILDQSKIEAGKMEIVEDVYELRPLVDDVQMIIENRIGSKQIHLIIDIDEKIPEFIVGDALRIRQILINLMNNAVKFTESGYIQLSAAIEAETEDAYKIRFGVKDSGQGIKEEDLDKLGKAFSQVDAKKNHNKEGTGLGLSISKDFIALMGGELKVTSVYGKGTEFFFTIEQKKAGENDKACESGKCAWKSKEFTSPQSRVLIVDDAEINLMMTEELLGPLEIKIDTVESGEKAIELIRKNEYHAILMDYMMPGMDGVETTTKIRKMASEYSDKSEYYKNIPIIALSGDTSERTREMFMMAGINDFTEKPVEYEKLKEVLLKWLPEELIKFK